MATHSNILACEVPWTEEPGWLQLMGLQRVRHESDVTEWLSMQTWAISTYTYTLMIISQFSCSVTSYSVWPHESQHARPPCPPPTPGLYPNSCPSSWWCHPAVSSSVVPFSSCPQFLPASGSFPMSQLFAWRGQSIGASASESVLPMNTQDWLSVGIHT